MDDLERLRGVGKGHFVQGSQLNVSLGVIMPLMGIEHVASDLHAPGLSQRSSD